MDAFKTSLVDEFKILYDKIMNGVSMKHIVRYLIEGIVIILAAFVINGKDYDLASLGLVASALSLTLFLFDLFSSDSALGLRVGSGIGIGLNIIRKGLIAV